MSCELLPDEIFLDLFDYLDGTDLFYTFYGLTSRFNWLLYKQYRNFRFNFHSIAKQKFEMICQQHLPLISDRVISFCLSEDDDTPHLIDRFFLYIPSLEQFSHLRALSILNIGVYKTIIKILDQCHYLPHLNYLKIISSYRFGSKTHYQSIIDRIWNLRELINGDFKSNVGFQLPSFISSSTKISSSLERLSLSGCPLKLNLINDLYEYTPRLKHLSLEFSDSYNDFIPCLYPTLINFKVRFSRLSDTSRLICLLQNMPNLCVLNIDSLCDMITGNQLEEVISKYLPKLRKFYLKMRSDLLFYQNKEERMNQIITPFRTSFWIDQHQWFFRCSCVVSNVYVYSSCQTLPYYMNAFPDLFISTDPNDNLQKFTNDITEITNERYFNSSIPSDIRLTNVRELVIVFPIQSQFWSIVPLLHRLHTLTVYVQNNTLQIKFRDLLNRTFRLHKLRIYKEGCPLWEPLTCVRPYHMELLKCTNVSVRHLDINKLGFVSTEEECLALAHSPLVNQCEILSIQMKFPENILCLINNMKNLRVLNVSWEDIEYSDDVSPSEINPEETIPWLKVHLPSTCFINVEERCSKKIRIWIS